MKIFRELTKIKSSKSAVATLEATGSSIVGVWKITLSLSVDGRKVAEHNKSSFSNDWKVRLEHGDFIAYAQRRVIPFEDADLYFSLE